MSPQPLRSNTKFGLIILGSFLLIVALLKVFHNFSGSSIFIFNFKSASLQKIVAKNIDGKKGKFAVYISDLSNPIVESYDLSGSDIFPAASLYKIYLIAAILKEIENGQLNTDDEISSTKDHLIEVLGYPDFGYEDAPDNITYTVQEALERVGRISDNFASVMLAEKIGWDKVQNMASQVGATQTTIKDPISTSAKDVAQFLKKIYQQSLSSDNKDEVVSPALARREMEILSLSQINDRIPAKLADNVKVVHKSGELPGLRHDAGIVYLDNHPYVIVLLSRDLEFEDEGVEVLANLSKDVYDYFASKK